MKLSLTLALALSALTTTAANAEISGFNCHSSGGGYLNQDFNVNVTESGDVAIKFSRTSKVLPTLGLQFLGQTIAGAHITFKADHCFISSQTTYESRSLACATGIIPTNAKLVLLDGSEQTLRLPNNFRIEAFRQENFKVAVDGSEYADKTLLVKIQEAASLGFHLLRSECQASL